MEKNWWIQISSARGPAECCWVVARLAEKIITDVESNNIKTSIIEVVQGENRNTYKSVLISMTGKDSSVMKPWIGTIKWMGQSPFRSLHKRKNWFVGVEMYLPPEISKTEAKDFKIETLKASGPGGQHVNKTESAVRVTHIPSGLNVCASEERSQFMNKKLAMARITQLLKEDENRKSQGVKQDRWQQHNELERGNPVKAFTGPKFREIP